MCANDLVGSEEEFAERGSQQLGEWEGYKERRHSSRLQQAMNRIQLVNYFGIDCSDGKAIDQKIEISLPQQNGTAGGSGKSPEKRLCESAEFDGLGLRSPERGLGGGIGLSEIRKVALISSKDHLLDQLVESGLP